MDFAHAGIHFLGAWEHCCLLGKGDHTGLLARVVGTCGLLAASIVMFITVRYWAKWFVGALGYLVINVAVGLLLGRTPSVPSIAASRWVFLQLLVLLVLALVLSVRYLSRTPLSLERVGLVALVLALSFSMMMNSNLPLVIAVAVLGLIQLLYLVQRTRVVTITGDKSPFHSQSGL
jgi:hypothetical protein